jgi:hypothetical protein
MLPPLRKACIPFDKKVKCPAFYKAGHLTIHIPVNWNYTFKEYLFSFKQGFHFLQGLPFGFGDIFVNK